MQDTDLKQRYWLRVVLALFIVMRVVYFDSKQGEKIDSTFRYWKYTQKLKCDTRLLKVNFTLATYI
jgi:hypothetical protein